MKKTEKKDVHRQPYLSRDTPEMTDSRGHEHEENGDASTSDDDSLSLLRNLTAWHSGGAAEDTEANDVDPRFGNKEQQEEKEKEKEKEAAMEMNPLKAPESGIPGGAQSAARRADSTPPSGRSAKVSQRVRPLSKVRLSKKNEKGETLLHKACQREDLGQVKALIQAGIDVNAEDYAGWTALHEASAFGDEAAVEELLKAGADVHARSCDGVTPLHDAVTAGYGQVVKLLLQYGSNVGDRNKAGLSAMDIAKEDGLRELLSLLESSVAAEQPCEARDEPPAAIVWSRVSGDRDGAGRPGDVQPGRRAPPADHVTRTAPPADHVTRTAPPADHVTRRAPPADHVTRRAPPADHRRSEALTAVLQEVGRKQAELSTWPLTGPEDAGRYHAALTQIQEVLVRVLTKQQLEKEELARRCRRVTDFLRQRLLKGQLESLASRQRTVLEVLQKQRRLVEVYLTTKASPSARPPHRRPRGRPRGRSAVRPPRQTATPRESLRPAAQAGAARSTPPKKPRARSTQSSGTRAGGNTSRRLDFQMKGNKALIQTPADGGNRAHLSQLVRSGVLPPGGVLQLLLKGRRHRAHVQGDGSIKDGGGRSHRAPERWLEAILGNNIPVSATYAWDKVTFADRPLSGYLLSAEAEGDPPPTGPPEADVQHGSAGSSPEELTPEAASLRRLMGIRTIRLVSDEELLPNAVMERHWEELLGGSEDWGAELL